MIKTIKFKSISIILVNVTLFTLKIIYCSFVFICQVIVSLASAKDEDREDDFQSISGDNYNHRTGELDSVKRPDGIYDDQNHNL